MKINKGDVAPEFSLFDSDKNKVSLSELRGQTIVLLFFPAAFTSTCTKEFCSVRDSISVYDQLKARVFGISVDMLYSLAKYKQEQNLNFSLLSDFNKETSIAYGCLLEQFTYGMRGVSKRAAFVIDKNGIIQYAEVLEKTGDIPDFVAIQQTLQMLN